MNDMSAMEKSNAKTGFTLRANFLPKCYSDYPLLLFTLLIMPFVYWFELWVVFPSIFPPPSMIYYTISALGLFEMHNLLGNFLAIVLCDTSIKGRSMPDENQIGVNYCSVCKTTTPPRSYHCPSCDICILKRDHHCVFTSCCIGHFNHRFFINFIFHISICCLFCTPFNIYFMWDIFSIKDISYLASFIFPIILFVVDFSPDNIDPRQIYTILFCVEICCLLFCFSWLFLHLKLVLQGTIIHEMKRCISFYDLGRRRNIEMVFGKRWYLTWISPFIVSELPSDGTTFPTRKDRKSARYSRNEKDL